MAAELHEVIGRGRPSNHQLTGRLERARLRNVSLRDELTALRAERAGLASEVGAMSARIVLAITADRPDVALHVAGRLDELAAQLARRTGPEPSAA